MIGEQIMPAYRKLRAFIADEYMAKTRDTVRHGRAAQRPGLVRVQRAHVDHHRQVAGARSTRSASSEVARIHGEMRKVMQQVGFKGSLQDFFKFMQNDPRFSFKTEDALLAHYRALEAKIGKKIPEQFSLIPKAPFEIRPVEPFRAQSMAGGQYYPPSEDGSRPGIFYVNTYDLPTRKTWDAEDLYLHEAIPGHHFQIALQQELTNLPKFRRFGGETAFAEGWGLYAESLGKDLGVYTDPYDYFGYLQNELWRAIRLVVDTGLHSKGWSREQVIKYMLDNSAESRNPSHRRSRALHGHPRPGAGLQDRRTEDPGTARPRGEGARQQVRRARIPRRSAEGRRGAAVGAGSQDRSLDRGEEGLIPAFGYVTKGPADAGPFSLRSRRDQRSSGLIHASPRRGCSTWV